MIQRVSVIPRVEWHGGKPDTIAQSADDASEEEPWVSRGYSGLVLGLAVGQGFKKQAESQRGSVNCAACVLP